VLDFGGYHLGNDGLEAIIPMLCQDYLLNIKSLDLSYNNLNDMGLDILIQNMASLGSTIEKLDISGNMISDIEINKISDFMRTGKLRRLYNVIAEDCKITDAGYRALNIAKKKVESM
jgi:Ran GTPase-activating protein (RanGAP) involved in mRNA processing and transport